MSKNTGKIFSESINSFNVTFGGENKIDAEVFAKTINEIIELAKASAKAINPDCFIRLDIKANNEGSFETVIEAVARHVANVFTKENTNLASSIVNGIFSFLGIKQHLKGSLCKKVTEEKNGLLKITNQDDEGKIFDKQVAYAYLGNANIENSIINIFNGVSESQRTTFALKSKDREECFLEEDFATMRRKTEETDSFQKGKNVIKTKTIKDCELFIKKPDLLGNSKWELILDKKILASIEDEIFINKIKSGAENVSGGTSLLCDLEITIETDDNYEIVKCDYVVKKVHDLKPNPKQQEMF